MPQPKPRTPSPTEIRDAARKVARRELWRRGELSFYLDKNQRGIRADILRTSRKRYVLECARRLGKSFLLIVMAYEACLQKRRARVVYAAPTYKDLIEFVFPIVEALNEDAPAECRPRFDSTRWHLVFPNGSHVALFGCDDQRKANRGRGPAADLVLVDEGGFNPVLGYVLRSVLKPQTLTTGAKTVIASSPSDQAGHEFTRICEIAAARGDDAYAHRTIHDNPRLTAEAIAEYIRQDAEDEGMTEAEYQQTDTYRREYLAQRITDRRLTAVPEFAENEAAIVREVPRPVFFDAYSALDPGGIDPHGLLFGHYHFKLDSLVIEDELLLRDGENTEQKAEATKAKESALWGGSACHDGTLRGIRDSGIKLPPWLNIEASLNPTAQPYLRVSDIDVDLIRELSSLHGLSFVPTDKTDKALHINNLRVLFRRGKILIHPRCRNLIRHLKTTLWKNEKRTEFARKNGEHGDLVDALSYMARNVAWGRNPEPPAWKEHPEKHFIPRELQVVSEEQSLAEGFRFGG